MKRGGDSLLHNPAAVPKKRKKRKEENALNISRVTEGLTDKEALKRDNRDEEEEEDEGDDGVVSVDLKTKSVQELLNCKDQSVAELQRVVSHGRFFQRIKNFGEKIFMRWVKNPVSHGAQEKFRS